MTGRRVAQQIPAFIVFDSVECAGRPVWAELSVTLFDNEDWVIESPTLMLRIAGDSTSGGRDIARFLLRAKSLRSRSRVAGTTEKCQEIVDEQ